MSRIESNVFDNLLKYFQSCAEELHLRAMRDGIFQNNPDAGDKRENALKDFLDRHLPERCAVNKGGNIIDSFNNESKQVDLAITNDFSLQFKEYSNYKLEKVFNVIEGCYCVISVKSKLTKDELFDAIDNLNSIPPLKDVPVLLPLANPDYILQEIPHRIIFAYDGHELETTKSHLLDYQQEKNIQPLYMPHMIIVNNRYHISKVGPGGYQDPGQPFQEFGTMQFYDKTRFIGGISLMHLLTRIQKISSFGSVISPTFDEYYRQMKITAENMDNAAP